MLCGVNRMSDFIFYNIIALPMRLTDDSRFKIVRVLGILLNIPWLVLSFPIALTLPFIILIEMLIDA